MRSYPFRRPSSKSVRPRLLIAAVASFLFPLAPILQATGELSLESAIYIFKPSDFNAVNVPGATAAADGQTLIFRSPASARFDQLTLALEGAHVAWGSCNSPPEAFSLIAAPPRVPITPGRPVSMTSSATVQYLEPASAGSFRMREISDTSPEAPHIRLTFTANPGESMAGDFLLNCDLDIATVSARKNIPGVALDIGKPLMASFNENLGIPVTPGQWAGALVKAPNGGEFSMLLLLRLTVGENAGMPPAPEGRVTDGIADANGAPHAFSWPSNRGLASVAVSAGADEGYSLQKFGGIGAEPKAETYVLAKGTFFEGFVRDSSLAREQFTEIVRVLEPALAVDRFYPSKEPKKANLLIVVHWGSTYVDEAPDAAATGGAGGGGAAGGEIGRLSLPSFFWPEQLAYSDADINYQLLGFDAARQKQYYRSLGLPMLRGPEADGRRFDDLYRYFVILEAYDFQTVGAGKVGPKPKLLWSVHYSLPAIGNNFSDGLPAMSKVAAKFFGRNIGGVLFRAQKIPEGVVKIGDPKEIDEAQWK
jgi:hypothetical protein